MRVHLGSDHAGFELKAHLVAWLESERYDVVDHGPVEYDPVDDYPPYVLRAAQAVVNDRGSLGIVLGGSGNGEQIAANKVRGVRAALAWTEDTAVLAREHNDANVISVGARMHTADEATRLVELFLDDRVQRRRAACAADRHDRGVREHRRAARAPRRPGRLTSSPEENVRRRTGTTVPGSWRKPPTPRAAGPPHPPGPEPARPRRARPGRCPRGRRHPGR